MFLNFTLCCLVLKVFFHGLISSCPPEKFCLTALRNFTHSQAAAGDAVAAAGDAVAAASDAVAAAVDGVAAAGDAVAAVDAVAANEAAQLMSPRQLRVISSSSLLIISS